MTTGRGFVQVLHAVQTPARDSVNAATRAAYIAGEHSGHRVGHIEGWRLGFAHGVIVTLVLGGIVLAIVHKALG